MWQVRFADREVSKKARSVRRAGAPFSCFVNVLALVRAKISQPRVLCVQTCIFVIKLRILALVGFLVIRVGVSVD